MKIFKIIVAWPTSWLLYYAGHLVSLCMSNRLEVLIYLLYPLYNTLMIWSGYVQDWATVNGKCFPWKYKEDAVYCDGDCY